MSYREAAIAWALNAPSNINRIDAHVAGQECGEQRAVEGIVKMLRKWASEESDVDTHVNWHLAADAIEQGGWR